MMMSILQKIKLIKQKELMHLRKEISLGDKNQIMNESAEPKGFEKALLEKKDQSYTLITEIKKASPSKGIIRENFNPIEIALSYEKGGGSCISVLTDKENFMGSNSYLKDVKRNTRLPVLRKDFIIDPLQVLESRKIGADCILIIIGMNSVEDNKKIESLALDIGLECILEVHSLEELEKTKSFFSNMIGINNRDLNSFITDLNTTANLIKFIPEDYLVISESGIFTKNDIKFIMDFEVNSFLIGENFMKSKNIEVEERNIALGTWTVQQLQEAVPGARTVPHIFVDDKYVGGFSELKEMLDG